MNFVLEHGTIRHVAHVTLLGSHLSESGNIKDDLKLHMKHRYLPVSKFFNFLRTNKLAPTAVKLKVLEACVASALLHNCEAFGDSIPDDLESLYYTLIKAALGVRKNTANDLVLIESGLVSLKGRIQCRQRKWYEKFVENLQPGSTRHNIFAFLQTQRSSFLRHYGQIMHNFDSIDSIRSHFMNENRDKIIRLANNGSHYKYQLYMLFNPQLKARNHMRDSSNTFSKLCLSSHSMPIELGRWNRISRENRLCSNCGVLGDEKHFIYHCPTIDRSKCLDIPTLSELYSYDKLPDLLRALALYL